MTRRVVTERAGGAAVERAVWVLGGTGRSGSAIAAGLCAAGMEAVLVGRDPARLARTAARLGGVGVVVAGSVEAMAAEVARQRPAVVVNTVGPFATAGPRLAAACLPSSHYLDLANDALAVSGVLALHERAVAAGRCLVPGAGFGVTASESALVRLCEGRPTPARVRVDMVPSLALQDGVLGEALARTILEGAPGLEGGGRFAGRCYRDGRLVRARLGGRPERLRLPDGGEVVTSSIPLGELVAAQRASGAPSVVAATSEFPHGPVARVVLPLAVAALHVAPLRELAVRRLARLAFSARERPRPHSWARASAQWPDGTRRVGWVRLGDAQDFTDRVPVEVCRRLLAGEGAPGAGTPASAFGTSLAAACGGVFLDEDPPAGAAGD